MESGRHLKLLVYRVLVYSIVQVLKHTVTAHQENNILTMYIYTPVYNMFHDMNTSMRLKYWSVLCFSISGPIP